MNCDFLIIGAGLSGLTIAERLATQQGKTSLIIEKRPHIGGNCYDYYDSSGILIHKYGPHYFRTNSKSVIKYLSEFTKWIPQKYKILSYFDNKYWNFPINLNTYEQYIGRKSSELEFKKYLNQYKKKIKIIKNSEDAIVSKVGWEFYEKFYKNYTKKQWQLYPNQLHPSVCARIPIRTNRNNNYFDEGFQALPKNGYTELFKKMISNAGDKIKIITNTDYKQITQKIKYKYLIYTGPIDEYYDYQFGFLPYRSLKFKIKNISPKSLKSREKISQKKGFWQPAVQINYPNEKKYTRIIELKHLTNQKINSSTIIKEYPKPYKINISEKITDNDNCKNILSSLKYDEQTCLNINTTEDNSKYLDNEPYYPIPTEESKNIYKKYLKQSQNEKNTFFIGRLANYKYLNMDQIVKNALYLYKNKLSKL